MAGLFMSRLTPPFRLAFDAAHCLLDKVNDWRTKADDAYRNGKRFGWKLAADELGELQDMLWNYFPPLEPALLNAADNAPMMFRELKGATPFHVLLALTHNTRLSMYCFSRLTNSGKKRLVVPSAQSDSFAPLLAGIVPMADDELRDLETRLQIAITKAEAISRRDNACRPEIVARSWFDTEPLQRYLAAIGDSAKTHRVDSVKLNSAIEFIRAKGPVFGKTIAKHIHISEQTFKRHYAPRLKQDFGVINQRGKGYRVP